MTDSRPPSGGKVYVNGPKLKYSKSQINGILKDLKGAGFKNN
jgi:hypothetical protein